jgi:hypothetical protein
MLFDFFDMADDYAERKVANTEINGVTVDTARVNDSTQPYETGVECELYNDKWIIVEQYDTKEEAEKGHEKWVKVFTDKLPDKLVDVSECEIISVLTMMGRHPKEYPLKVIN